MDFVSLKFDEVRTSFAAIKRQRSSSVVGYILNGKILKIEYLTVQKTDRLNAFATSIVEISI
ncbi:hypothetical protein GCM10009347_13550 [Shewanella algicola]|uniref:Uncharacterized protein n=1 Tax=Shewanella algicola TaxID=640633 RepID=A0A9X2CD21_9GAMM|nr:hypothetical protein [Shewanella algicola]MCL1104981.1 hypothetical protein [Shewanella algicola]GGP47675.1 hypothetical protein GCM10009347_13550 [Shewanella algicola]